MFQQSLFGLDGLDMEGLAAPAAGVTLADIRPVQRQWVDNTFDLWSADVGCLGVAATGSGKTFYAAGVGRRVVDGWLDSTVPGCKQSLLFIAPRIGLVDQAVATFQTLLPDVLVEREQGENRSYGDAGIVVACLDSIAQQRRLNRLGRDRFSAVVWDEAHRYRGGNKMVDRVLEWFDPSARRIGLTATPDRGDGYDLANIFPKLAFTYDIVDGIGDGYLVPVFQVYDDPTGQVTLDGVPLDEDGDFSAKELSSKMRQAGPVAAVVKAAVKWSNHTNTYAGKRPTIVACVDTEHADLVAIQLNEWHARRGTGRAAAIHSRMDVKDQEDVIAAWHRGGLQYLVHVDMLTEGFDSDRPKVFVNGRPTKVRRIVAQNVGRIVRPDRSVRAALNAESDPAKRKLLIAGSPKPGALYVDVCGTDHKLVVSLADVFGRPGDPPEVREGAKRKSADRGDKPGDPMADLEDARRKRLEEKAAKWKGVLMDAELMTRQVDPFDITQVTARKEPPWFRGKRPSEKMRNFLLKAGIPKVEVDRMTYWNAKVKIDVVVDRRERGLCTYRQAEHLRKNGYDPTTVTFEEASAILDSIFGRR